MKISVIQMNIGHGKPENNRKNAIRLIAEAAAGKPDVILLPEMWTTGYDLDNIEHICDIDAVPTLPLLKELAARHKVNLVCGSFANKENGKLYNTAFVIDREGNTVGKYSKVHLFKLMGEHNCFASGRECCTFELDGVKCGLIICYDLRFPELVRKLALAGIKVLFVPAEWPAARMEHWVTLLRARAIENQIFVAAANRAGSEEVEEFAGGSMLIDPWGNIVAHAEGGEQILDGALDLGIIDRIKSKIDILGDRMPEVY